MTNSTHDCTNTKKKSLSRKLTGKATGKMKKVLRLTDEIRPGADALFFIRLFARACQPMC